MDSVSNFRAIMVSREGVPILKVNMVYLGQLWHYLMFKDTSTPVSVGLGHFLPSPTPRQKEKRDRGTSTDR